MPRKQAEGARMRYLEKMNIPEQAKKYLGQVSSSVLLLPAASV